MRYKKTEVCQACAQIKNVCQTCLLGQWCGWVGGVGGWVVWVGGRVGGVGRWCGVDGWVLCVWCVMYIVRTLARVMCPD